MLSAAFSWRPLSLFSLWIILLPPSLPPFILPLTNQCVRCLVPLVWALMAGGHWFASHGGVTLSRAGCAISGSPWTSQAPTSTSDTVVKWSYIKINIYLTQSTTRSMGVVSGHSFGSSTVSPACITSMCSVQHFPGSHSPCLAFGSFFYPHPSPSPPPPLFFHQ